MEQLIEKIKKTGNPSVAGLDPKLDFIPEFIKEKNFEAYGKNLKGAAHALLDFNKGLMDALSGIVPAVKPQSAYYEMYGVPGVEALHETIAYAKEKGFYVILDVKRNDIGTTAEAYAMAYLGATPLSEGEAEEGFGADSVTVNPYLGTDGMKPFVEQCKAHEKSIFTLVKTSNPSSGEFQDLILGDKPLYEKVAEKVNEWGEGTEGESGYTAVGAVVGATYPTQAEALRKLMPKVYFLVPGYGAQGGKAKDVALSFNSDGLGAIVNSSRGIMCAYQKQGFPETQFAEVARAEAIRMRDEIVSFIR